jgi:hypothetical protein
MSHKQSNSQHDSQRHTSPVGLRVTLWHALALNASFYEEASSTTRNRRIALAIVLLAAISHALGSTVILLISQVTLPTLVWGCLLNGASVVAGYYLWALAIWKVGQWLKPIDPTYSDLLIPIGFAYAPQALNFLTLIPLIGRPIELVLAAWSLLAVVVAIRQGLDVSTRLAIVISLLSWIPLQTAIGAIQALAQ